MILAARASLCGTPSLGATDNDTNLGNVGSLLVGDFGSLAPNLIQPCLELALSSR
jgi:hypothetical protein